MRASNNLILREVAGEYILIPVGDMALRIHGMVSLTESGAFLWQCLANDRSETELVDAILDEYDVDRATAERDVREFIGKIRGVGLLEDPV